MAATVSAPAFAETVERLAVYPELEKRMIWDDFLEYFAHVGLLGDTREEVCSRLLSAGIPVRHRRLLNSMLDKSQASRMQREYDNHLRKPDERYPSNGESVESVVAEVETTPAVVADLCAIIASGLCGVFASDVAERIILDQIEQHIGAVNDHVGLRESVHVHTPKTSAPALLRMRVHRELHRRLETLVDSGLFGTDTEQAARWVIEKQLLTATKRLFTRHSLPLNPDDVRGALGAHDLQPIDPAPHWSPRSGIANIQCAVSERAALDMAHLLATGLMGNSMNECGNRLLSEGIGEAISTAQEMSTQRTRRFSVG